MLGYLYLSARGSYSQGAVAEGSSLASQPPTCLKSTAWFEYLKIVTNNSMGIPNPILRCFICIYRVAWYINHTFVRESHIMIIICCWWSRWFTIYTCQRGTTRECRSSNRSNAIRDCNACQRFATIECRISNRSDAIADCHISKAFAITE